jgi:glycosyltransferase involved in cell wall biosynthesis
MMRDAQISVIVPARNADSTIELQLTSLTEQVVNVPFEVIIVNNGSSDNTYAVAQRWASCWDLIRVIDASERRGISYARNMGIQAADGDLILFCDADDQVAAGWIHAMSIALQRADVVGGRLSVLELNTESSRETIAGWPPDGLPVTMRFLPYAFGANLTIFNCEGY